MGTKRIEIDEASLAMLQEIKKFHNMKQDPEAIRVLIGQEYREIQNKVLPETMRVLLDDAKLRYMEQYGLLLDFQAVNDYLLDEYHFLDKVEIELGAKYIFNDLTRLAQKVKRN